MGSRLRGFVSVVLALLLVLTVALACDDAPASGVVVGKSHQASDVLVSVVCTGKTCTPVVTVIPERWELCLRGDDHPDKPQVGCRDVDRDVWARYQVGDHYPKAAP